MIRIRLAVVAGAFALSAGMSAAADYGTVKGTVKLSNPPAPAPINVTTDQQHCNSKGPLKSEEVVVGKTGGLKYVIVYLRPDSDNATAEFPKDKVHPSLKDAKPGVLEIDQPCCQFVPRVFAVREQTKVIIKNSSPVNHNANFASDTQTFNNNTPPGQAQTTQPLKPQKGLISLSCSIHPWMKATGMVFDHPYFAVTDDAGNFTLDQVPAGKWRIVYRHETGYHKGKDGRLGFPIEVKAGDNTVPPVEFENPTITQKK